MSRPNMNQGMPNGIPSQWCGTQAPYPVPPQKHMTPHVLNNGLGSSQSSRDSSPMSRISDIPASQLPPSRGHIPASQLPPGRPGVSPILGTNGQMSASATQVSTATPQASPRVSNFSTSTPIPPSINSNGKRSDINSAVSGEIVQPNSVNSSAVSHINRTTAPMYTNSQVGSYSAVPQQQPHQQQQHAAPMNMRANIQQPFPGTAPPQGMPPAPVPNPATNLVGQQTTLGHASSTPALSHQNMPPVKHNLNQPQNIPRPLSSGPQLQQNFDQKLPPQPLLGQSQFSQSQGQLTSSVSQQNMMPGVNPAQVTPAVSNANYQHQKPAPSGLFDVNQQHKPQLPPTMANQTLSQQFNNLPTSVAPQQTVAPPMTSSATVSPVASENNRILTNYSSQNVVRPPVQNMNPSPNMYNANATSNIPPKGPPVPMNLPVSQYPTTPVSSIHSKRYPQPQYQNPTQQPIQQPNMYQPNTNVQSAQQNAYNQQQTNTYYQQQQQQQKQPNMGYQQPNYPQQPNQQRNYQQNMNQQMSNLSVAKSGFNKLWGRDNFDLLQCPNILPREQIEPLNVSLGQEFLDSANCSPEIFRCTMTKIPESNSLLQKSRLPLGVLIHPFKDLNHLPVIQCSTIVRCRACRTYINPFIFFVDTKRWKCNLCYRVNELPEEFQYDPVSKSYGDPSRRPEIKSSTIEYIAPSEYMLRPPQPAVYLFLLDISRLAVESGYLHTVCDVLSSQLATLPGDARTQIGFLAYNSTLHFFSLAEGLSQPHEMIVSDIDDVYLPCPDNLLVNLKEHMELVTDLLTQLPTRYQNSFDNGSALGAALQAAFKLMSSTGGRVTVFQTSLPTLGPGALTVREDPNQRAGKEAPHLNPATDFYKRLALDCSGHQVAVDLFVLNSQYVDVATLSGISRFSGGCMYHFPLFKASRTLQSESLERCFRRYLTRKIGFEAVMRIRCTRGLAIHTFHGNFFVRSTDLLSLPNVNPDAGFGMQVSIEESLADLQSVCFQAALLYTSSKGERRIRVHTLCLPIVTTLPEVLNAADQQCIVGLLAKMAVDRSLQSSLSDARDAFINVAIDILSSYKMSLNMGTAGSGLLAPESLKLLPLYILALLKYTAFRTGQSTRLDDRVFAMCDMKTLPLAQLLQQVYPDLYPIYNLSECPSVVDNEGTVVPQPPRLQLTARNIDSHGAYLLDAGQQMIIYVCPNVSPIFLTHTLGVPSYNSITDLCYELPKFEHPDNQRLHAFINSLNDEKPYVASLQIIRENSPNRTLLLERLIEDRIESALSYNEFLQHLKTQVK